jgi:hypothetical protein
MKVQALVLLALLVIVSPVAALAAEPSNGTLSSAKDEVTWSGGAVASNPLLCVGTSDPTCDTFRLTVSSPSIQRVLVAIAPGEGYEEDDYDLFVFDDQGALLGSSASSGGKESIVFNHTGSAFYDIQVQPWLVTPGSNYRGVAMRTRDMAIDAEQGDCLELVPAAIALPVVDNGQRIELSVMLLLDGTDANVAQQLMERAAVSYSPLGIDLVLKRTRPVNYTSILSGDLIRDAKITVGGKPPKGIDLVGVFTNKQMQGVAGGATVVGQADCIGGVRWPEHSFFVVSDIRDIEDPQTGTTGTLNQLGFNPNVDATAEVFAHEIGHLMGAHHHYANCVEGNLASGGDGDISPCSLMFNAVNFASLRFTVLSGAVVRGHAVNYAAP